MVSRYGMRTGTSRASTLACSFMRASSVSTAASPMAVTMVWCVSSLRLIRSVGSFSAARAKNAPTLPSSFLFAASMATGYCGAGSGSGSMAVLPSSDSVSDARVSASFGTTMISPAFADFTSVASLPIMTYRCPRRSFLPVRELISSMPGVSVPLKIFR